MYNQAEQIIQLVVMAGGEQDMDNQAEQIVQLVVVAGGEQHMDNQAGQIIQLVVMAGGEQQGQDGGERRGPCGRGLFAGHPGAAAVVAGRSLLVRSGDHAAGHHQIAAG